MTAAQTGAHAGALPNLFHTDFQKQFELVYTSAQYIFDIFTLALAGPVEAFEMDLFKAIKTIMMDLSFFYFIFFKHCW